MSDLLKRVGIFKLTRYLIEMEPEAVIESLKDILIIATKNDFITDTLIYKGCSKHFDLVKEGSVIPEYSADIQTLHSEGNKIGIVVEWHKIT